MSDVDAIRCMASEHDLEFVDLTTYGVDRGAGEILSADLARRHHMVAIKRKFGTPVIATSDPDDLYAQDSVRASLGRDFISVVASREQISDYIDQLFGTEMDVDDAPVADLGRPEWLDDGPDGSSLGSDTIEEGTSPESELDESPSESFDPDRELTEVVADELALLDDLPDLRSEDAEVDGEPQATLEPETPSESPSSGGRRGKKGDRKGKSSAPPEETKVVVDEAVTGWQELEVEAPELEVSADAADGAGVHPEDAAPGELDMLAASVGSSVADGTVHDDVDGADRSSR